MQHSVVIDMPGLDGPLIVVGLLVVLLLLRIPTTRRVLARLGRRVSDWATTHWTRAEESDWAEDELWQMERRRKLCADLRRVEHLVATDTWMSATRQRGNRIAYDRLVDELRHTPDVFPASLQPQTFSRWDESAIDTRSWGPTFDGFSQRPRTVEVLEIGWGRRRR